MCNAYFFSFVVAMYIGSTVFTLSLDNEKSKKKNFVYKKSSKAKNKVMAHSRPDCGLYSVPLWIRQVNLWMGVT